jgi:outer membrane protein
MTKKMLIALSLILILSLPTLTVLAEETSPPQPQLEVISLDKCLEMALNNSQQLKMVTKNVEIAEAGVREVNGGFLPSVNYMVNYSKLSEGTPYFDPSSKSVKVTPDTSFLGKISVTEPLYTGGRLTNSLRMAELKLKMVQEDQRKAKQQITYNVKEAYYHLWLAEQMFKVAKSSYDNLGHHVEQVKNFYKVGTSSKFDLLRAEVQWDGLKPQVIKAENGIALAKLGLATLVGMDKERPFTVSYDTTQLTLPESTSSSLKTVLEAAYQDRPEIHQVQQLAELKKYKTVLTRAAFKPILAASANFQELGSDLSPSTWDFSWNLSLNLSGLLFDGFATQSRITAAQKDEEVTAISEISLRDQIHFEVEQALQSLKESIETTHANQANIDLTKESLRLTQARFDAGMATTMDIMDSQLALDQSLSGYYQGISSYLIAVAKLDLVSGKNPPVEVK